MSACWPRSNSRRKSGAVLDLIQDLLDHWQDGRIKLFLTSRALSFRRAHVALFQEGSYEPLVATGAKKDNVFAFIRRTRNAAAITAVPRLVTKLGPAGHLTERVWKTSALILPKGPPPDWVNVLTGEKLQARASKQRGLLPLAEVFGKFPVALLATELGRAFDLHEWRDRADDSCHGGRYEV